MDGRQRIGLQRALVQEALGKLKAATELFGIEEGMVAGDLTEDLQIWQAKLAEFEAWILTESPLA